MTSDNYLDRKTAGGLRSEKGCPHGLNLHKKWGREEPAQRKQIL